MRNLALRNLKFINKSEYKFCENCNCETPHNLESQCMVCETCEYIWCDHCGRFETIERNNQQNHWIFYKSRTKIFLENKNNYKIINYLEENIIGFGVLIKSNKAFCGVYFWYIDNVLYYIGESIDILSRSYDHIREMCEFPEYWVNIVNEIKNGHTLEIKFKEYKECELKEKELYWIDKLKPLVQKCNGINDNVIPFNNRNFNINNSKEKYENRRN